MANDAIPLLNLKSEAFLAWEDIQARKHYLYDGSVYAMAGANRNHWSITPVLASMCSSRLGKGVCRYRDADTKVFIAESGNYYYPDGMIACPPQYLNEWSGVIDNPIVIFEVLSSSTWRFDREGKFDDYRRLPSFHEYVLIHSDLKRVEVFTRQADGKWGLSVYMPGTAAMIESVGIELPLEELYEEAVFEDEKGL